MSTRRPEAAAMTEERSSALAVADTLGHQSEVSQDALLEDT
jgi:hypothetical protein